jgi:hypothetical protein
MMIKHELQIKMHQVSGVEVVEMTGAIDALAFADLSATLGRMIAEVTPALSWNAHASPTSAAHS